MIIVLLLLGARFDHSIASGCCNDWDDYSTLPCISCICDDSVSQHITRGSSQSESGYRKANTHTTSLARLLACLPSAAAVPSTAAAERVQRIFGR